MFQKALWLRTYQQSKYMVWLFWLVSFYNLSYKYYMASIEQQYFLKENKEWNYVYHYQFDLSLMDPVIFQSGALIVLACTLIGWERQNNSIDFLWSMPFKRSHIFMTKWLFGICNIVAAVSINWGLFAIMKKMTFHNKYQVFSPFHPYFIYMLIVLIAIYTLALCIGTITGNIVSQGFLTAAIFMFPLLLPSLISGVIAVHSNIDFHENNSNMHRVMENIRISGPAEDFRIKFNYDPQSAYTDNDGVRHNAPNFTKVPSAKLLIAPITHIIILLPLGMYLYVRSVNERNGNFLLYPKLQKIFMACAIFFIGIIGGLMIPGSQSLLNFYIGFFGTSLISYFLLPKILKWKFSWNFK
ncbi:acetoin ABC transporter permease [Bacillus pseudomycoides]|uniref:Acetoin ABC transporter permease n=1 Tax=Bacillus pseudomycoides TaxID=64104 RepID=A0AA91ZSY7_9BACI|nr:MULTISPECIES: ABC-2 transporter permease [Bacillus]PEB53180.1 acetoin ABC transporter permease [Bacillus sp. AFS098217]PED82226.1 acetoin ABC transporter permease [Bacillus pseudomycoides]PEU13448.1 acetoin ABC transporter permease [Bacillus sp. AFS014408]PEU14574.1 acetoin ABC transporter permease [Bacillus sp. AFS019443]PFW61718.1 acetoin ABC transporter permease [Bacillus sp. AFS075034]